MQKNNWQHGPEGRSAFVLSAFYRPVFALLQKIKRNIQSYLINKNAAPD
jgi:hypothetical protein